MRGVSVGIDIEVRVDAEVRHNLDRPGFYVCQLKKIIRLLNDCD